jgi:hypothetical protein
MPSFSTEVPFNARRYLKYLACAGYSGRGAFLLFFNVQKVSKKKKKLSACRGEGSAVGPLLAVLRCRCAALLVLVLMSALAMPNCGAQGAPTV